MKNLALLLGATLLAGGALAKLPDPSPEAKAKADLSKAENAHKDKIANYQLCQSQDRAAKRYLGSAEGKGKKPVATPPCADPGKFVPPAPEAVAVAAPAASAASATSAPAAAPSAPPAAAPAAPAAPAPATPPAPAPAKK